MSYRNPKVINNSIVKRMASMADTSQPCLAIAFSLAAYAGEVTTSQVDGATIQIDADGGTSSELLITLTVNKIDESGDATTDTTISINGATYDTLEEIIDYINEQNGFTAWALHAPHNMDTGNDNFADLAETEIRTDGVAYECLYRDVDAFTFDSDYVNWLRVGYPTERDSGIISIVRLSGTTTGNTNGTVKLYRDEKDGSKTELQSFSQNTTQTAYVDRDSDNALSYEGPILVEVKSDNLTATDIALEYMTGEY